MSATEAAKLKSSDPLIENFDLVEDRRPTGSSPGLVLFNAVFIVPHFHDICLKGRTEKGQPQHQLFEERLGFLSCACVMRKTFPVLISVIPKYILTIIY